jgi:hypothetical protein
MRGMRIADRGLRNLPRQLICFLFRNPHSSHESYGSKHDDEQEDQ